MYVTWVTLAPSTITQVRSGLDGTNLNVTTTGTSTQFVDGAKAHKVRYIHRVTLTNLIPATRYCTMVSIKKRRKTKYFFMWIKQFSLFKRNKFIAAFRSHWFVSQWRQQFYPALTWDTNIDQCSVRSYSPIKFLPPLCLPTSFASQGIRSRLYAEYMYLVKAMCCSWFLIFCFCFITFYVLFCRLLLW